ncbi:YeeE/YedE family protein [Paroceanicella profunda]|uniref:YeeE/YedE family protein n=1 Tax=Paroceanicella profunda TaxID=2579971 RepID=A0A5B8G0T6_9RHOB|nr:YeeE/YedE thiosulfate transporter family protein [Paroceanicella profunda]QDL93420.1 YeeE/YedE family protein [Paroceanicella profunda]
MPQDWVNGLTGGGLIGLAAALYLLMNGRIMGVSGILGGLLAPGPRAERAERALFVAGVIVAPLALTAFGDGLHLEVTAAPALLVAGGLLVGVGTRMGSGCTSGHGVCGLSRLSRRSVVAVALFMISAGATVAVLRLAGGL